ncbi:MAG: hypothetical protein ACW987_19415 [Candidatus Thorarchaeota archaeon]|jgi:hypothetical protein
MTRKRTLGFSPKSRLGYRYKGKKRHNLFLAERNQRWEKVDEAIVRELCEFHDLDPEIWFDPDKKETLKWHGAWDNLKKFLEDNGMRVFARWRHWQTEFDA